MSEMTSPMCPSRLEKNLDDQLNWVTRLSRSLQRWNALFRLTQALSTLHFRRAQKIRCFLFLWSFHLCWLALVGEAINFNSRRRVKPTGKSAAKLLGASSPPPNANPHILFKRTCQLRSAKLKNRLRETIQRSEIQTSVPTGNLS